MGGGGEAHQIKINSLLLVVELNKLFKSAVIKFAQNEPQNATLTVLSLENGQVWNFDQRNFTINFQKTQRKIQLNLPSGFPLGKAIFRFDFGPHYLENELEVIPGIAKLDSNKKYNNSLSVERKNYLNQCRREKKMLKKLATSDLSQNPPSPHFALSPLPQVSSAVPRKRLSGVKRRLNDENDQLPAGVHKVVPHTLPAQSLPLTVLPAQSLPSTLPAQSLPSVTLLPAQSLPSTTLPIKSLPLTALPAPQERVEKLEYQPQTEETLTSGIVFASKPVTDSIDDELDSTTVALLRALNEQFPGLFNTSG